jgi:hypothetical protein
MAMQRERKRGNRRKFWLPVRRCRFFGKDTLETNKYMGSGGRGGGWQKLTLASDHNVE